MHAWRAEARKERGDNRQLLLLLLLFLSAAAAAAVPAIAADVHCLLSAALCQNYSMPGPELHGLKLQQAAQHVQHAPHLPAYTCVPSVNLGIQPAAVCNPGGCAALTGWAGAHEHASISGGWVPLPKLMLAADAGLCERMCPQAVAVHDMQDCMHCRHMYSHQLTSLMHVTSCR